MKAQVPMRAVLLVAVGLTSSVVWSCGDEQQATRDVSVQILLQGLSENPALLDVVLPAGTYAFNASTTIAAPTTTVAVSIVESEPVTTVSIDVPIVDIVDAVLGDYCAGTANAVLVPGSPQTVTIDMACGGDLPDAEAVIGFTFCNNPDATLFTLAPAPPWTGGSSVEVTVEVEDHEPAESIESVSAAFVGESLSSDLSSTGGDVYTGSIEAPSNAGTYTLELSIVDGDCGATVITKEGLEVSP